MVESERFKIQNPPIDVAAISSLGSRAIDAAASTLKALNMGTQFNWNMLL